MSIKRRFNVSLPDHLADAVEERAKALQASPTEYAGDVIRWWFGQGCPALTPEEEALRWVNSKGADLTLSKKPAVEDRTSDLSASLEIFRELKAKGYHQDKDGNWIKPKSGNQSATKR